ncbi:MAG TPA: lysophospholipid acyltransferase family protein [Deltaproteobacteria bacterium]|nr:lysophospholipid acyltransferase family protein [Deltaproteobacteria bacterium]
MITDILYRCPVCGGFDWFKDTQCIHCRTPVEIRSRSEVSINAQKNTVAHWYEKVLSFDLPEADSGIILTSKLVRLSREATMGVYKGYAGVTATHYTRAFADEGTLVLKTDEILFSGSKETISIPIGQITSLTIETNTIIVISRNHGVLFFDFTEEPGKKWEDCIRKALVRFHSPRKIVEFYPRLRFENSLRETPGKQKGHPYLHVPVKRWYRSDYSPLLDLLRPIVKPLIRSVFSVDIQGLDNIPEHGSAVLLSNHTSFLDSIILGVFPRRNIWFMAKNSQYKGAFLTWALRHLRSFPVRRYTIDAQAVRNAIRIVQQGHILGIFPEGERTWDNTLLPFKHGTIRLILALGRPVIPVGISGAYELMPRWTSSIKRVPVKIRIGEPVQFDHIPPQQQTRVDLNRTSAQLKEHIVRLSGEVT